MADGSGAGVCGVILKRGLSFSLGVHFTVLQSEIFVILAFAKDPVEKNYTREQIYVCWGSQATS
jgi:hypothetical protein